MRPPYETFTKPTCKGSIALGNGCGRCEKCEWERRQITQALASNPPHTSGGHIPTGAAGGPSGPPPHVGSGVRPPTQDNIGLQDLVMRKFAESDRRVNGILKAMLWGEAKARLRMVATLSDQQPATPEGVVRCEAISSRVEAFISDFEHQGMDEP